MIAHYCNHCKETREPEVTTEYKAGDVLEFKHCPECGSDRVTPFDELAEGMMEDNR